MIKTATMGAALLATAFASRAYAQAAVEDPGYCAQYYPNANCQNYGPGNPLYRGFYASHNFAPAEPSGGYVVTAPVRARHRHHHHG